MLSKSKWQEENERNAGKKNRNNLCKNQKNGCLKCSLNNEISMQSRKSLQEYMKFLLKEFPDVFLDICVAHLKNPDPRSES